MHMSSSGKGIWNFASAFSQVSCKAAQPKQGQALQQEHSIFIRLQVITAYSFYTLVVLEPLYPLHLPFARRAKRALADMNRTRHALQDSP